MATIMQSVTLTTMECGRCAGTYAISENYRQHCYDHRGEWHCPYCQASWSYRETVADRLKRQIAEKERQLAAKDNAIAWERSRHDQTKAELRETESRRRAEKAAKTRIKNRVTKGACPCCNRYFANLHRHMANQHPDYTSTES